MWNLNLEEHSMYVITFQKYRTSTLLTKQLINV